MEKNLTETDGSEEELIRKHIMGLMSKLPLEIIFDILSRLPIKTLSQCRWVSKSWYQLIHLPRFAQLQLAHAVKTFSPCVTYANTHDREFYLVDHQVFDNHGYSTTIHHPRIKGFKYDFEIVGSCNGLICFGPDTLEFKPKPYCICNVVTGEQINLPKSPKHTTPPGTHGFGFDPINNEYKVVRVMEETMDGYIYTPGSDKWRTIPHVPSGFLSTSVFLNGALHSSTYKEAQSSFSIVVFDMATEKFREMSPPKCFAPANMFDHGDKLIPRWKNLGILGGCLCFIDAEFDDHIEIWVMKTYGVQESWCKEYTFRKERKPFGFWLGNYQVVKLNTGELLVQHDRKDVLHRYEKNLLHYYNTGANTFKPIATHGIPSRALILYPVIHVGSLISPNNLSRSTKSYCNKRNRFKASLLQSVNVPMTSDQAGKVDQSDEYFHELVNRARTAIQTPDLIDAVVTCDVKFSKTNVEVSTDARSMKYVYNYAYKGHEQTTLVLEKVDEI